MMQRLCDLRNGQPRGAMANLPVPTFSLDQIAKEARVAPATLIAWETTHALITPQILPRRGRVYTRQDLDHILILKHLILENGIDPAHVAETLRCCGVQAAPPLQEILKPRPILQQVNAAHLNQWYLSQALVASERQPEQLHAQLTNALDPLRVAFNARSAQCWLTDAGELAPLGMPCKQTSLQRAARQAALDALTRQEMITVTHPRTGSLIFALPITNQSGPQGVLTLVRAAPQRITPEERRVLAIIALQMAQAIATAAIAAHNAILERIFATIDTAIIFKEKETLIYNPAALKLAANRAAILAARDAGAPEPRPEWRTSYPDGAEIAAEDLPSARVQSGRDAAVHCEFAILPDPETAPQHVVPLLVTATPVTDAAGQRSGTVISAQDLRVYKETERIKFDYFRNKVHDFRTQLTIIQLAKRRMGLDAEKLIDQRLPADQFLQDWHHWDAVIQTNLNRINQEIDGILLLKIDSGTWEHMSLFDSVNGLLRTLIKELGPQRLAWETEATDSGLRGCWNPKDIECICKNLITNALRYSPEDTLIFVQLYSREVEGRRTAFLTVQDQGYGIPLEDHERIFEKDYRSVAHMPGAIIGNGYGLHHCRLLAERNGGRLSALSEGPQKGSCFTLRLPLVE